MSHFLERLTYLSRRREPFADGLGELRDEDRMWEEGYRQRWQHDKIVRSTHGVNCTGGCSWKIYVKSGLVTREILCKSSLVSVAVNSHPNSSVRGPTQYAMWRECRW